MATHPAVIRARRRIAEAISEFAAEQQWKPEDWAIFMRVNEEWFSIHIILVAKAFEGRDRRECYGEVWDYVRRSLQADAPGLSVDTFLVVMDPETAYSGRLSGVTDDYTEEPKVVASHS